ncbi:AAA family ATPase [Patescibacteria group bacterium]|nr:AAA family ATPase [Patescibacteria group bacterium]
MIKSERIAKKINEQISVWGNDHAKLIIAIEGYAGSGKTTVAEYLAKGNTNVAVLHLDDFIKPWEDRKRLMNNVGDKSKVFEYEWYRYDDLEKVLKQFKVKKRGVMKYKAYDFNKNDFGPAKSLDLSKKILVIEGIFLLHQEHAISALWDKKVYLDINFAKADRMRIAREKKKWGKAYLPEAHIDNWTKYFKIAYRRYVKEHKPQRMCGLRFE